MKFAAAALIGAVSAFDVKSLYSYKVNTSAQCTTALPEAAVELQSAFQNLPMDYAAQNAGVKVAEFVGAFSTVCTYEGDLMVCSDAAEKKLNSTYFAAGGALRACTAPECKALGTSFRNYLMTVRECLTRLPSGAAKTMVKVVVPTATGQQRIQREVMDVQLDLERISQSPAAQSILADLQQFAQSPEGQALQQQAMAEAQDPRVQALQKELQEAIQALESGSRPLANGFEINNNALPQIVKEFDDVQEVAKQLEAAEGDPMADPVLQRALQNRNLQSAIQKLQRLAASPEGQNLQKDLQEVAQALQQEVQVLDVPANIEQTLAPLAQ